MKTKRLRLPLMLMAVVTLFAAAWAGLLRLGWGLPSLSPALALDHGPLMVAAFFGTLISLERAVALGKGWAYIAPLLNGVGGLLVVFRLGAQAGPLLIALGSLWLVMIFAVVLKGHFTGYTLVMALGALALAGGNLLWVLGWPVHRFVLWWAGFLILTIAGERLELSRLMQRSRFQLFGFTSATALYLGGLAVMLFAWELGVRINSAGMLALALWLLRYDIARRTVKQSGLTRYIAVCLLSGYFWLAASGLIGLFYGGLQAGPIYDSMLHAIFLGFVFVMVFGHAPIIFPAVLGLDINYQPRFYIPLILLHTTLILRTGGEMLGWGWARLWGGLFNEIAVLLYVFIIAGKQIFSAGTLKKRKAR